MSDTWRLEWADLLTAGGNGRVTVVEAMETLAGWDFRTRSTRAALWEAVPPSVRLVWAAEYFKHALLQRRRVRDSVVFALRTEEGGFKAVEIADKIEPILQAEREWCGTSILAEMHLRSAKRRSQPLAAPRSAEALAA